MIRVTSTGTTRLGPLDQPPFRHGHVRRLQPCITCGGATRRTVPRPGRMPGETSRCVLCSRCELPSADDQFLMVLFGVDTVPELDAGYERYVARARGRSEDFAGQPVRAGQDTAAEAER